MDGADELRLGEVEFVEALVEENTAAIESRPHGPVTQDRSSGEEGR
jgi:hypothetical protein